MELMKIYHRANEPSAGFAILTKLAPTVETAHAMFAVYAQHQCVKNASIWNIMNVLGVLCKEVVEEVN